MMVASRELYSSTSRKLTVKVFLSGRIRFLVSAMYLSSPSTLNLKERGDGHAQRENRLICGYILHLYSYTYTRGGVEYRIIFPGGGGGGG